MALNRLVPMLHVADIERSLAFYRERLGFTPVMFFYPDDVVALHRELTQRGVEVGELSVTFYRMKEFSFLDPDGHMLTFGQGTDEPPTPEE
jgi:uncharacterized glyoxalase superfamily protein PhnB